MQCPSGRLRPLFGVSFELLEQGIPAHSRKVSSPQPMFSSWMFALWIVILGRQCLRIIRVWAPVPRISLFGPAVPPNYSSSGSGLSNLSFRASSAFELFEFGPWSLESSIFGLATPSYYSIADFGPSNYLLRASSASTLFEGGCPILRITSFGHQHFVLFGCSSLSFEFLFGAFNALHSKYLNLGGNIPVQMPYVKYDGKSMVCNTRWPGICIKRTLPSNFPYLRYEVCTDGHIGCLSLNWASTR
jgi:hypothetical protein